MNRARVIERFATDGAADGTIDGTTDGATDLGRAAVYRTTEGTAKGATGNTAERGDHTLNPGLLPQGTLTPAAILIPLVDRADGMTVLLTRRSEQMATHPGQISFPGGHIEPDDGSPENAALRETEEEVGLARRHIEVIGRLDRYITRTGFDITPVVGLVEPVFDLATDPNEVAEAFEVPLAFLLDPANHERHSRQFEGKKRHFYAMPYGDYYIWGATAGMLINLYERLTLR